MRRWAKLSLVMLLVVGMIAAGSIAAVGLTKYKTFGKGEAAGRGTYGSPYLSVDSTTLRNPEVMRFTVKSPNKISVTVNWSVFCWNENSLATINTSGSFTKNTPITQRINSVNVSKWHYCNLITSAWHSDVAKMVLKQQAKYS